MSSHGASATWRKPMRSPGTPASAAPSSPRASMWKVSTARVIAGWSARDDGLPGLAHPVDVPAPGERLEGHGHAVPRRPISPTRCSCSAREVEVVDGAGGGVGAGQQGRRTELGHHARAWCGAGAARRRTASGGTPSTSRTGWNRAISRPRSAQRAATSRGRERRPDQVVVEELDRVEARRRRPRRACRSSTPLRETVAMPLRIRRSAPRSDASSARSRRADR